MIGIYHSKDLDGYASAAIMKLRFPNIKLIGYDYTDGASNLFERLEPCVADAAEGIIMSDVCLPTMSDMKRLSEIGPLTWIDHHKSQIEEYESFCSENGSFCSTSLKMGVSACELTYQYLFPENKIPTAIFLLGKYDTWRKANEKGFTWDDALQFQMGMRLEENYTIDRVVELMMAGKRGIEKIIDVGKSIISYQRQFNKYIISKNAFEGKINGLNAIICNSGVSNSQLFESIWDEGKYQLMARYLYNGRGYNFSLYSTLDSVDCSAVAKSFGGGGHKGAAGFSVDSLDFIEK